jgi:RNA polymerase sigma factor (sigma-70 family)
MATGPVNAVLQHLRKLEALQAAGNLSDGQLLRRFAGDRDEAAFNVLLQRHGPMVWSVCQRVLRSAHNSEDVFQATFLALAKKAASIRKQESIASWLYGVAFRLSRQLRAREYRRPVPEAMPPEDPAQDLNRHTSVKELLAVLDEELQRVSEHYRMPLVLCFLEGKTRDEAALALGCSLSTLKRRLDKGREVLRARLTRRGLTLSGALLSTVLAKDVAAAVPPTLLVPTIKAAVLVAAGRSATAIVPAQVITLTKGVLEAMLLTKLKIATAVVLSVVVLGAGAGICTRQAGAGPGPGTAGQAGSKDPAPAQQKEAKDPVQEKLLKELEQTREALQKALDAEKKAREKELQARQLAEVAQQKAEALRQEAQAQRDKAARALAVAEIEVEHFAKALALAKAQANLVLIGKLKVRLGGGGTVSLKAAKLPVELVFTNAQDEDQLITSRQIAVCLLDKNGERVNAGLIVHDLENKPFPIKGGKGKVTILTPHISLDPVVRPGEEYFLVFAVGHQWGMVKLTTKE